MDDRAYFAFLRHGDYAQRPATPSARQPFALTRKGVEQARLGLATLIRQLDMFAMAPAPQIHASRQLRAWQTAHELMAGLRGQGYEVDGIVEDSRLAERGLGSAANLTISEIESVLAADPRFGLLHLAGSRTVTTACRWKGLKASRRPVRGWRPICKR